MKFKQLFGVKLALDAYLGISHLRINLGDSLLRHKHQATTCVTTCFNISNIFKQARHPLAGRAVLQRTKISGPVSKLKTGNFVFFVFWGDFGIYTNFYYFCYAYDQIRNPICLNLTHYALVEEVEVDYDDDFEDYEDDDFEEETESTSENTEEVLAIAGNYRSARQAR